jgi:hypothetical protein
MITILHLITNIKMGHFLTDPSFPYQPLSKLSFTIDLPFLNLSRYRARITFPVPLPVLAFSLTEVLDSLLLLPLANKFVNYQDLVDIALMLFFASARPAG